LHRKKTLTSALARTELSIPGLLREQTFGDEDLRVLVRKEPEAKLDGDGNVRSLTKLHVGLGAPIWYTLRGPWSDPTFDCKSKHTESEREMDQKKKKKLNLCLVP
jgi:hypothetical protein